MGTNITIYDSPDSVNVNDPEATLTVYEMFIGVGPTGPAGPAGAAAVAGPLPSSYVEMETPQTVTSGTLIDIPGVSTTITLDSTVHIAVIMNCMISSDGICDLDLGISINGTDHDVVTTHLNGSSDAGVTTVIHRTETELAAGTYTVKGRFARSSGVKTPQVDRADFLVFALQGAKGADSTITIVPTADNDFVLGNSGGTWEKKTLAQTKTALGLATTTTTNDFMAGDGAGAWAKKTLAETKTILSITNAPNVATTAAGDLIMGDGAGAWVKKTVAEAQAILGVSVHELQKFVTNPQAVYAQRPQIVLMRTSAAITITRIHIHGSDTTPTSELAGDLKFADDINAGGFANATVIDVCDTTNGLFTATSSFDDATVPSGKYIYFQVDSSPHADWKDFFIEIYYTFD